MRVIVFLQILLFNPFQHGNGTQWGWGGGALHKNSMKTNIGVESGYLSHGV